MHPCASTGNIRFKRIADKKRRAEF
jgi:hypothetical protein